MKFNFAPFISQFAFFAIFLPLCEFLIEEFGFYAKRKLNLMAYAINGFCTMDISKRFIALSNV